MYSSSSFWDYSTIMLLFTFLVTLFVGFLPAIVAHLVGDRQLRNFSLLLGFPSILLPVWIISAVRMVNTIPIREKNTPRGIKLGWSIFWGLIVCLSGYYFFEFLTRYLSARELFSWVPGNYSGTIWIRIIRFGIVLILAITALVMGMVSQGKKRWKMQIISCGLLTFLTPVSFLTVEGIVQPVFAFLFCVLALAGSILNGLLVIQTFGRGKIHTSRCSQCNRVGTGDRKFCGYCGGSMVRVADTETQQIRHCRSCGKVLKSGQQFCGYCGERQ